MAKKRKRKKKEMTNENVFFLFFFFFSEAPEMFALKMGIRRFSLQTHIYESSVWKNMLIQVDKKMIFKAIEI